MSDYSEHGAIPVEDSAIDDPPTVDDILERQEIEHPEQARTSTSRAATTDEEAATQDAGGEVIDRQADGAPDIEGPNSI